MDNVEGWEMVFESERGLGEGWDSRVQRVVGLYSCVFGGGRALS